MPQQFVETKPLPVILVHGIGSSDEDMDTSSLWGRIPAALRAAGHPVFFGNTGAWTPVRENGARLAQTIGTVLERTSASQVILVAHSKGGLDARAALLLPGVPVRVRAVITLSSPHRGMAFCRWLAKSRVLLPQVAAPFLNAGAQRREEAADAWGCLHDLTPEGANRLAQEERERLAGEESPIFISCGFRETRERARRNFVGCAVAHFDGENDGLVSLASTQYGDHRIIAVEGPLDHEMPVDQSRHRPMLVDSAGTRYAAIESLIVDLVREASA